MKLLYRFFLLLLCFPLALSATDHRGTLQVNNWKPNSTKNGPEIASITIKWAIDNNSGKPTANFNLQWYLGRNYRFQDSLYSFRDLPEAKKLISIRNLVLEADVISEGRKLGRIRFDMGATPPHGGIWGGAVSYRYEWRNFIKKRFESEEEQNAWEDRLKDAFDYDIQLTNLQVNALDFGGLQFVEEEIQFRQNQAAFAAIVAEAEAAFSQGKWEESIQLYKQARLLSPNDASIQQKINRSFYFKYVQEGDSFFEKKEYEVALQSYQAAQSLGTGEKLHIDKIQTTEQEISMRNQTQQLWQQLLDQYNEKAIMAASYAENAFRKATLAEDAALEDCYLRNADFYRCEESYFNQKKDKAEQEARYMIYKNPQDKIASELTKSCEEPDCSVATELVADSNKTAKFHLEIAQRKYQKSQELKDNQLFWQAGREQLSLALSLDSTLAEAYLLKAYFAADVIDQLAEVEKALSLNPRLKEAIDERQSLQGEFSQELGQRIAAGDVTYVQRAQKSNLLGSSLAIDGKTPAAFAVSHDQSEVLAVIMETDLQPKSSEVLTQKQDLLEMAATENKVKSATYLLTKGADPAKLGATGKSPLMLATEAGALDVLNVFLEQGADMKMDQAVLLTIEKGNLALLNTFLNKGASPAITDAAGDNLLMMAIRLGHDHLIDDLLSKGADVNHTNQEGMTPLAYAAEKQSASIVQKLLGYQAEVEPSLKVLAPQGIIFTQFLSEQALSFWMQKEMPTQVPLLLNYHPSLALAKHPIGRAFIFQALAVGQEATATALLASKGDFSQAVDGKYILMEAIIVGADSFVNALLTNMDISLNIQNQKEESPLHLAVHYNHRSIVLLLLANHHSLDPLDKNGRTPLHIALLEGRKELAAMLIGAGADFSLQDNKNWQPVHMAAYAGDLHHLGLLIEKGAPVNAVGESGMTPLHYAAQNADLPMIEYLLAAGADKYVEDFFGRTPYKIAKKAKQKELAKWLK